MVDPLISAAHVIWYMPTLLLLIIQVLTIKDKNWGHTLLLASAWLMVIIGTGVHGFLLASKDVWWPLGISAVMFIAILSNWFGWWGNE